MENKEKMLKELKEALEQKRGAFGYMNSHDCNGQYVTCVSEPVLQEIKYTAYHEGQKHPVAERITKVIANDTVTVVFFDDNTKEIVRLSAGEKYDLETAVAYAIVKKIFKTNSAFKKTIKSVLKDCRTPVANEAAPTTPVVVEEKPKRAKEVFATEENYEEKREEKKKAAIEKANKPYTGKKRGRAPCTKCKVTYESVAAQPELAPLRGYILPIKSRDKNKTVIVTFNKQLYSLKKGEYEFYHGDKGWVGGRGRKAKK